VSATPTPPVLAAHRLRMEFGGVVAVAEVSLDVVRGSAVGLIGPNGAGKSTVVGIIAGALRPSAGSVTFCGEPITGMRPYRVARRGLVRTFQLSSQFSRLTVMENLVAGAPGQRGETLRGALLGPRYWSAEERRVATRAEALLAEFGMEPAADQLAGSLSGGQRRLVELMRALMAEPRMLLLDEPVAGVHPTLVDVLEHHLRRLRDLGITMLVVEHELGVIERLCDRVVVMGQGRVIAEGTMAAVRGSQEVIDAYIGA